MGVYDCEKRFITPTKFTIYCDGATSANGKSNAIGGWAFAIINDKDEVIYSDSDKVVGATNQQMELTALARACAYAVLNVSVEENFNIFSDSAYIINCHDQYWWVNWERNGWKNAKKEPVANKELWEQIIPYFKRSNFNFYKVKGHSGNDDWNNYVDKMAVEARKR